MINNMEEYKKEIDYNLLDLRIHQENMDTTLEVIKIGERNGIDMSETISIYQDMARNREEKRKQIGSTPE